LKRKRGGAGDDRLFQTGEKMNRIQRRKRGRRGRRSTYLLAFCNKKEGKKGRAGGFILVLAEGGVGGEESSLLLQFGEDPTKKRGK